MPLLRIENLSKRFDRITAVENINLNIETGEILGIIGPDGSGKTTLLRLLMGLLTPTNGIIKFEGSDIHKNPASIKEQAGYMPQHFSLYGDLRVSENLKFFSQLYQVPKPQYETRKKELLHFSGLGPFTKRLSRNLSGGMQKKLALACNLFHTPKILFLDEPTTGVDPVSRKELWDLLFRLNREGVSMVITTPYMDEARKCHRVGLIHEGSILSCLPPDRLIASMQDNVIELLTGHPQARNVLKNIPQLINIYPYGGTLHMTFPAGTDGLKLTREFIKKNNVPAENIQQITPSFEDAFLYMLRRQDQKRRENG